MKMTVTARIRLDGCVNYDIMVVGEGRIMVLLCLVQNIMNLSLDNIDHLVSAGLSNRRMSSGLGVLPSPNLKDKRSCVDSKHEVKVTRVLVLGPPKVGKTAIISQFLYDHFQKSYKPTFQEMYKVNLEVGCRKLSLNIEDTSGTFMSEFPAMAKVSLATADVVLLVFSLNNEESFEQVAVLRDMVMENRGPDMPIVIAGNKMDLDRKLDEKETEGVVECDWENRYVECSAKLDQNINEVFKELLRQASDENCSNSSTVMVRRESMPIVPTFVQAADKSSLQDKESGRRESIVVSLKRESCKVS